MIKINNAVIGYKDKEILKTINLSINKGEFIGVIGPSGAGKTTLLRLITKKADIISGDAKILNYNLLSISKKELVKLRSKVGFIFQGFNLVDRMNVIENVLTGMLSKISLFRSVIKLYKDENIEKAYLCLKSVGLENEALSRCDKLSGGQRQRVAIARALAQEPEVILADEPVAALDPYSAKQVMEILRRINKDFNVTEKYLLKALEYDPDSVILNYKLATFYLHFQNIPKAIDYSEKTLIIKPDFEPAHELLANIYTATNNVKGAIAEYKFLLNKRPDNPNLLFRYGIFLLKGENYEKAKQIFRKLTKNKKYNAMAYYYLGKTYSQLNLLKEAISYYKKALKIKPDFQQAYYEIALIYQLQGNDKKAYETYKQVLKIDPDNILAREKIVRYLVKSNKLNEALKQLEKLKELEGDNFNINIKLALLYMELKNYDKAINILKNLKQFPKAVYYLITIYLKQDKVNRAVEELYQFDTTSPFYFDSAVLVINYLIDKKQYQNALNIYLDVINKIKDKNIKIYKFGLYLFEKSHSYKRGIQFINSAIKDFPDISELYFYRGIFYDKLGDLKNVIKSMKKAIEINPKSADALNYLAYTYAINKINLEKGEELAKKALKLKPNSAAITDTLGWIYFQQKKYEEALTTLREAFKLDKGREPEIMYHLGAAYLKLQDRENGIKLLKQALKKCNNEKLKKQILKTLEKEK
jgi:ABC-type phosphate/phosphonate transport system ATPase subunit/Tfp pilus assembly protein PilF